MFLQRIKFQAKANQSSCVPDIHLLANTFEDKQRFVRSMLPMLNEALNVSLTNDEITIIALLLNTKAVDSSENRIGLVIMGHGVSTAGSVADFINKVLLTKMAHSVDVPIEMDSQSALDAVCKATVCADCGKGVIILTDTDNFKSYEENLKCRTGIQCRVIPCMSTVMALELCKSILTTDDSIDDICTRCIVSYQEYMNTMFRNFLQNNKPVPLADAERNVIIISCITGAGSARRLREFLLQHPSVYMNAEVISIGLKDDIRDMALQLGRRLKLIISFVDPHITGVPFISMEKVASREGINRIALILKGWTGPDLDMHWPQEDMSLNKRFHLLEQRISYFAPSIEVEQAAKQASYVVSEIKKIWSRDFPEDLQVRIYIHVITMFERLNTHGFLPMPEDIVGLVSKNSDFYRKLTDILKKACMALDLEFQESEAYYLLLALPESSEETAVQD